MMPPEKDGCLFSIKRKNKSDVFRDEIAKVRLDTGIDYFIGFHNPRHTVATRLAQMQVKIPTVQEILGYTNPGTTLIYTHALFERKKAAISASQKCHNF